MKDLERELSLKPGSLYAAFGSKEGLYVLALDRYAAEGTERLVALAQTAAPLDALAAQLAQVAEGGKPCMLAKTVLELGPEGGAIAERAQAHLAAMEDLFAGIFETAQVRGDVAPHHDPHALARRYQSDLMGLRVTAQRPGIDAPALAREIARRLEGLA